MTLRNGFTIGEWEVFPLESRLSRDGKDWRIQPKTMKVLLCLAEAEGRVVARDELLREVWGERAVTDEPLTKSISKLRRVLGDDRADPRYILTIPKSGYRLLQPALPITDAPSTARKPSRRLTVIALVAAIGIVASALVFTSIQRTAGIAKPRMQSVVVLPFVDMSPSGDQEYMSDGVAEELLNLLSKNPDLKVISRTSAFSFKGKAVDVREIAEQLDVAYVLEGSVRTADDRIRVTTQLIDAVADTRLWAQTYDAEMADIFSIQDEIAATVVRKLELTLLGNVPKTRETSPDAYAEFLQARYLHEHPAGDSLQNAFKHYEAALAIDPTYVPAWVWLAALYDDTVNSSGLARDEVGRLARRAIDNALQIDSDDPLALGMSGVLIDAWDNDPATAATRMQRALDLDPNNPILLRWAAILLNSLGRYDEAVRVTEYLFTQDPIGDIAKVNLASTYLLAGRFDDAIRVCQISVALSSEPGPCRSRLIIAHLYAGDPASALDLLQPIEGSRVYTRLAPMVFHALGRSADFGTALAALESNYEAGDTGLAYWLGHTFVFVGKYDAALDWFERAVDHGVAGPSPSAAYFSLMVDDSRWQKLLQRVGRDAETLRTIRLAVTLPAA